MNITKHFNKHSKFLVTLLCFVLVILIGIFDYFVGPDFSSLIAYLIPVIFITRIAGRMAGILTSFASAASWILADILADPDYTFRVSLFWNHMENLTIFLIIVYILLKLSQIEEEKKNMVSMLAHDMKNPALVAKGFAMRMLSGKNGPLTEHQKQSISLINDELSRLERLILDFLEMSKFESTKLKLSPEPLDISLQIKKHIEVLKPAADKKSIRILRDYPDEGVPPVYADAVQIDRVIRNLMGNAINYTNQDGTITIKLSVNNKYVLVQVKDTGMGIPKEHIKKVFTPFHRVNSGPGGFGLGLPIVKLIIEAHGGNIWVKSVPGKGSSFSFTLPRFRAKHV